LFAFRPSPMLVVYNLRSNTAVNMGDSNGKDDWRTSSRSGPISAPWKRRLFEPSCSTISSMERHRRGRAIPCLNHLNLRAAPVLLLKMPCRRNISSRFSAKATHREPGTASCPAWLSNNAILTSPLTTSSWTRAIQREGARLSLQVKRSLTISKAKTNTDFRDIIRDSWLTFSKDDFRRSVDRFGAAVGSIAKDKGRALATLGGLARESLQLNPPFADNCARFKGGRGSGQ